MRGITTFVATSDDTATVCCLIARWRAAVLRRAFMHSTVAAKQRKKQFLFVELRTVVRSTRRGRRGQAEPGGCPALGCGRMPLPPPFFNGVQAFSQLHIWHRGS